MSFSYTFLWRTTKCRTDAFYRGLIPSRTRCTIVSHWIFLIVTLIESWVLGSSNHISYLYVSHDHSLRTLLVAPITEPNICSPVADRKYPQWVRVRKSLVVPTIYHTYIADVFKLLQSSEYNSHPVYPVDGFYMVMVTGKLIKAAAISVGYSPTYPYS